MDGGTLEARKWIWLVLEHHDCEALVDVTATFFGTGRSLLEYEDGSSEMSALHDTFEAVDPVVLRCELKLTLKRVAQVS